MPKPLRITRREELVTLRQHLGLTQVELGSLLELGGKRPGLTISRYERGSIPLPPRVLKAVRLLVMVLNKKEGDPDVTH